MLKYLIKMLSRSYITYLLMSVLIINGIYFAYLTNAGNLVIQSATEYYLLNYRPHIVLFLVTPIHSLETNLTRIVDELANVNNTAYEIIMDSYGNLNISTLFCMYRFNYNGTMVQIFIGKIESLKEFGFKSVDTSCDNCIIILRGDVPATKNILRHIINKNSYELLKANYTAYDYPLSSDSLESIDLLIPVHNLSETLINDLFNELVGNTLNNSIVFYRVTVGYAFMALNYVNIESVGNCLGSPNKVLEQVIPPFADFIEEFGQSINYTVHYGFTVSKLTDHSERKQESNTGEGELFVIKEDIAELLLSISDIIVNFIGRNVDLLLLFYAPIGVFLVFITGKMKRLLFGEGFRVLDIRGFNIRKSNLYSLLAVLFIMLAFLTCIDLLLYYLLHIDLSVVFVYTVTMFLVFIIVYFLSGLKESRVPKWLGAALFVMFITFLIIGYLRLTVRYAAFNYRFLVVPITIILSLMPVYSILLAYILYVVFNKVLLILENSLSSYVYFLRSVQNYGIVLFVGIYSLVISMFSYFTPLSNIYNYVINNQEYVTTLGYNRVAEIGILNHWTATQIPLFFVLSIASISLSTILLTRDALRLLKYSKVRGIDRRFVYKKLIGANLLVLFFTVFIIFITYVLFMLFIDAHIGLFYSAIKTNMSFDPQTHAPNIYIEKVYTPIHLWEVGR